VNVPTNPRTPPGYDSGAAGSERTRRAFPASAPAQTRAALRFRRTHSFRVRVFSSISCRYTRCPGQSRVVNSRSVQTCEFNSPVHIPAQSQKNKRTDRPNAHVLLLHFWTSDLAAGIGRSNSLSASRAALSRHSCRLGPPCSGFQAWREPGAEVRFCPVTVRQVRACSTRPLF
jgi:hypothetical protein